MKTNLKDLLHAINVIGEDMDVSVDGHDSIAVCPPVMFTPAGLKHFEIALGATVEGCNVSSEKERIDDEAWNLLVSLAGYCGCKNFEVWFEGEQAIEI